MRGMFIAVTLLAVKVALAAPELGLNAHQSTSVGLDVSRDAAVKWVRVDLNWPDAQPANAAPDFTLFDQIVDGARARGLSVLAILAYTPAWASSGDAKGDGPTNDVPDSAKWVAYVSAAVQHFSGRVSYFELWNEPNLGQFWEGTTQQYLDLVLEPGADAVHAGGGLVVGPALATVGSQYAAWMDAVLAQAGGKLDVVSGHIYANFTADDANAGVTSDSFFNKLESHRLIQVGGTTVYEGPLSFREVMLAHGATQPFWLTETGYDAAYGDATAEGKQATYYRRVLDAMTSRPWWTATHFYEAFDEPGTSYHWGVTLHDDTAPGGYRTKPAFDVLKQGLPDGGTADLAAVDLAGADLAGVNLPDLAVPSEADLSGVQPPDLSAKPAQAAGGCSVGGGGAPSWLVMWSILMLFLRRRTRTIRA